MNIDLFDFELPESLIAQTPLPDRTGSRLLTLNKRTGEIGHHRFDELHQFLQAGDLLVLNDTRVIPARLFGVKEGTGAKVEVLLLKSLGHDRWEALVKPGKRLKRGAVIHFGARESGYAGGEEENGKGASVGDEGTTARFDDDGAARPGSGTNGRPNDVSSARSGETADAPMLTAVIEEEQDMGGRILRFRYRGIFNEILDRLGQMPLPPYIKEQLPDKERYQTVYAKHEGSAAAPTAGLHFTEAYLQKLAAQGVELAYITLHVGLGTFRPVTAERVEEHRMHAEYYRISQETAERINQVRERGGRIVAVGTTSARTLETLAQRFADKPLEACDGWTDIFIYPGYTFRLVDALITNFHLPKSTLLMLVSALAGRDTILKAYREAVERRYRFFSFGDAMFIY